MLLLLRLGDSIGNDVFDGGGGVAIGGVVVVDRGVVTIGVGIVCVVAFGGLSLLVCLCLLTLRCLIVTINATVEGL